MGTEAQMHRRADERSSVSQIEETSATSTKLANARAHFRELAKHMGALNIEISEIEGRHAAETEELQEKLEDAEGKASVEKERADSYARMLEDFNDVERGLRGFDEVLFSWNSVARAQ